VKSRGTRHSNQVRELVLSDEGVSLADVYTSGGEVLMGTMRWQKEAADRVLREHAECAARQEQARVEVELTDLAAQISALQKQGRTEKSGAAAARHCTSCGERPGIGASGLNGPAQTPRYRGRYEGWGGAVQGALR
jgi:circadian clock protein KaiC